MSACTGMNASQRLSETGVVHRSITTKAQHEDHPATEISGSPRAHFMLSRDSPIAAGL